MKKQILTASLIAVFSVLAFITPRIAKQTAPLPEAASSELSSVDGYVLREYDGAIGVFRAGVSELLTVINIDPRTLPETDRAALIRGIYAADDDELNRRIEDFSS